MFKNGEELEWLAVREPPTWVPALCLGPAPASADPPMEFSVNLTGELADAVTELDPERLGALVVGTPFNAPVEDLRVPTGKQPHVGTSPGTSPLPLSKVVP